MSMKKGIYFLLIVIKYLFIPLTAHAHVTGNTASQTGKKIGVANIYSVIEGENCCTPKIIAGKINIS